MARIEVAAIKTGDATAARIQENFDQTQAAIREQAYLVAARGRDHDFENWLQAEREVVWVPPCELVEQNGDFRLRAAVPGLEAKQVRLTALPEALIIEASGISKPGVPAEPLFSEFNPNGILRRIDLPAPIDATAVKAKLERGLLEVVAPKSERTKAATKVKVKPAAKKRSPAKKAASPRKKATARTKKSATPRAKKTA